MTTSAPRDIAALVLAAGALDDATPLATGAWGARTVVEQVASTAAEVFDTVVVVLGCDGERVAETVDLMDATVVVDPEWEEGIASPLRVGLDTLSRDPGIEHVVVVDAAMPEIDVRVLDDLVTAHTAAPHAMPGRRVGDRSATVGKFRYARSGPVVLAREIWERFLGMEGDTPIVQTLSAHSDWVNEVWIDRIPPTEVKSVDDLNGIAPRR